VNVLHCNLTYKQIVNLVSQVLQFRSQFDVCHTHTYWLFVSFAYSLFCCCVQFSKLRFVIQSAGGEVILCNSDTVPSDGELLSDSACIMGCDVSSESKSGICSWIHRIQQLLKRFLRGANFSPFM